jgi:hypothetical protein
MRVMGTTCQICGMPVQHDHYVPANGMSGIYRGASGEFQPLFHFGREHDWLRKAVALRLADDEKPQILEGEVHDGALESRNQTTVVLGGIDERAALHRICWELAGKREWKNLKNVHPAEDLKPYMHQLFDFTALQSDQKGWMLVDPTLDTPDGQRNKARILKNLG